MGIRIFFGLFIYNLIAKHLPCSSSSFKIGQKQLRRLCGKMILAKCGKNVNIEKNATFSSQLEIGNNSGIGINSKLQGKIIIGDNVMMGPNCTIYTRNHKHERIDIPMNQQGFDETKPVIIGDDVWIGGGVTILPGVTIGQGSIIGACTVVTKNVPDYSVVCGNPGRVVKNRKEANSL